MNSLVQIGIVLTAIDKMSGVINGATDKATHGFTKLQNKIQQVSRAMTEMGTKSMLMGQGIIHALEAPIKAFAEEENALARARSSFMNAVGKVPPEFSEIAAIADRLGVELPGTKADFLTLFGSMKSLGVTADSLKKGTLEAASYLGAVLQIPYAQAGEHVAKFSQALGIAAEDQVKFADTIQRTAFLGVKTEEMHFGFSKLAGTLKGFHMQGLESANAMTPLLAMLIRTGRSGEEAGTGLSNVMNQMVNMKKVDETNSILRKFGIHLDFVDKKTGQFKKNPLEFVAQLEKLNKLNDVTKTAVLQKLFGSGGASDIASILATEGVAGYQKMVNDMVDQADLKTKLNEQLGTLSNLWDATTGTMTSSMAAFAGSAKADLAGLVKKLGEFADNIGKWVDSNPALSRGLFLGAGAAGVLLVGLGGLGITLGIIGRVASAALGPLRLLAVAFRVVGMALTLNPASLLILAVIAAIAAGAFLIYKYWKPIKAFFGGVWKGIQEGLAPLRPLFDSLCEAIKPAINWFKSLFVQVDTGTQKAAALGEGFGRLIGRLLDLSVSFMSLPVKIIAAFAKAAIEMYKAGGSFIDQLWAGMKASAEKLYNGVKEIAAKVRSYWPFSPAKEGPLRDLNRVRIIETIAESVHPASLVNAMRAAATAGMLALAPLTSPAMASLSSPAMVASAHASATPRPALAAAPAHGGGGGAVTVHFAPQITIQGTGTAKDDLIAALKERQHELIRLIEEAMARNARRQY